MCFFYIYIYIYTHTHTQPDYPTKKIHFYDKNIDSSCDIEIEFYAKFEKLSYSVAAWLFVNWEANKCMFMYIQEMLKELFNCDKLFR